MFLKSLSATEYRQLTANTVSLATKGTRPGILLTTDQLIIKHTYKRSFFSSSRLWPYPLRFKNNAIHLAAKGFQAPKVNAIFNFPTGQCYLTIYQYIPGSTVYDIAKQGKREILQQLPEFLAKLHQAGIYFRDIHTKNILFQPNGQFALIDITSVKTHSSALSLQQQVRNIAHLLRKQECQQALSVLGIEQLLQHYFELIKLSPSQQEKFIAHLNRRLAQFHSALKL